MEALDVLERKKGFMDYYGELLGTEDVDSLEDIKKKCLFGLVLDPKKYLESKSHLCTDRPSWERFARICEEVNYHARKNWLIYYTFMNEEEIKEEKQNDLRYYEELRNFVLRSSLSPVSDRYSLNRTYKVDMSKLINAKGETVIERKDIDFDELYPNLKKALEDMMSPSRTFATKENYDYCMEILNKKIYSLKYMSTQQYKNQKIAGLRLSPEEKRKILADIKNNPRQLLTDKTLSDPMTIRGLVYRVQLGMGADFVPIDQTVDFPDGNQDRSHDRDKVNPTLK